MGRGNLIRRVLIVAALAAVAASTAAAAVGVHWTSLARGVTESSASNQPTGYVAVTRTQEARFLRRLSSADQSKIAHVNLQRTGLVAVFLDGLPCGRDITVNHVTRNASTLTVGVQWTRPPIGMAMCVRTSTPYVVIGVTRATLGHPAPTHVKVVAVART
jgi:hypothetical protein